VPCCAELRRGVIIDVHADNEVLVERTWTVFCSEVL